jgi:hypothetical protein
MMTYRSGSKAESKRPTSRPGDRDALKIKEIGPTSADGVEAELDHKQFIEAFGGWWVEPSEFLV